MGDGSNSTKTIDTSRMPVSALSAECKFRDILLSSQLSTPIIIVKGPAGDKTAEGTLNVLHQLVGISIR